VVGREDGAADAFHDGQAVGHLGQQPTDRLDLGVELAPEHVGLGVEVPEEGAPADPGGGRDLVDGGLLEALIGEQPQGDQFQGAGAGAARPAAAAAIRGVRVDGRRPSSLDSLIHGRYSTDIRHTVTKSWEDALSDDIVVEDSVVEDDAADDALLENLLVEEVSIDGMCGVY
jgi:mycofactocin precursor